MADKYDSIYTGAEIDEAVGKALSEVPEYWIPLDFSGGMISVPADKLGEVSLALRNPQYYNILGCKFTMGGVFTGRLINNGGYNVFSCPLTASVASEFGISGPASLIVYDSGGADIVAEVVPDVFVVTLTPTAQDFSGTMDKTPKEIYDAYMAGRQIRAKMLGFYGDAYVNLWACMTSATVRYYPEQPEWGSASYVEIRFEFVVLYGETYFLVLSQTSNFSSTYSTTVFPLTPM